MTATSASFQWCPWDNGWLMGSFSVLQQLNIPHAVSSRQGPDVQRVATETETLGRNVARALDLAEVAFAEQVHGAAVRVVRQGGCAGPVDALCTDRPGLALVGKSADCPLVLVADANAGCVGFAHASWRATVAGIVPNLITCMADAFGCHPRHTVACICPSAGPECYEVDPEVRIAALENIGGHAHRFFARQADRFLFDLWAANTEALVRSGVPRGNVVSSGICTICHNDLLPSYRREGAAAGRFMAIIGLLDGKK